MFTISEELWLRNDLGVLDKIILIEFNRCNYVSINEEAFGHLLVFTKCDYKNVARSINRLIDMGLISGNKVYEIQKKSNEEDKKDAISESINNKDDIDTFIKDFKEVIADKYKECSKENNIAIAEEALRLVIYCFKNNSKKKELFKNISKDNLIAIYEEAISIKIKQKDNTLKINPFAMITNYINKSI